MTIPIPPTQGAQIGSGNTQNNYFGSSQPVAWPVEVGSPPTLAAAYQSRSAVRDRIHSAWSGEAGTVVLTQLVTGDGGVGKSQVAAGIFEDARAGTELRVWVTATTLDLIQTSFASAGAAVGAIVAPEESMAGQASRFLDWLDSTSRSWLIVLDDLGVDPPRMRGWWPRGHGRTLVTTRRREAGYAAAGRATVKMGVYAAEEASQYLRDRLATADHPRVLEGLSGLVNDLHFLPVALAQAAAVILNRGITCAQYRGEWADESSRLTDLFPEDARDDYAFTVAATWALAINEANRRAPVGSALPAARIAAFLDPHGAPQSMWMSESVRDYLTSQGGGLTSEREALDALRLLHRFSIIDHDPSRLGAEVRMHAVAQRAVRETVDGWDSYHPAHIVARGLSEIWPSADQHADVQAVLRSNASELARRLDPQQTWADGLPAWILWWSWSLRTSGDPVTAVQRDGETVDVAARRLGPTHPDTLTARANLAASFWAAGRLDEAIPLEQQVLADRLEVLGPTHPDTLTARANLAASFRAAGRLDEAIPLDQQVLADSVEVLGPTHPATLTARAKVERNRAAAEDAR